MDKIVTLLFLLTVETIVVPPNFVFGANLAEPCGQRDRLNIVSLSIYADPLPDKSRVEAWLLRLRSSSEADCQTVIRVIETERDMVAAETLALIRWGANEIKLAPAPGYQFTADEGCFDVVLVSKQSKIKIDGPSAFCALHIDNRFWTMR